VGLEDLEGKGDRYVVIVEWNTVTIGLMWVLSWYFEWEHYYLCLSSPKRLHHISQEQGLDAMMFNKNTAQVCGEVNYAC
jgi:hypothetical protein